MILESFSAGYWLAPELNVASHGGKRAVVQDAVFDELVKETGDEAPRIMVGGRRYRLHPSWGMPHHVVALPDETYSGSGSEAVLVSRPERRWLFEL
ncbi:hypothetical protein HRTV-25_gp5 [Halorubrum tailed virus 25]|uniref:Uncharacterized protein n=1 Tax=Halorubrum tailed virus 25 TaxID=2878006 RepID=A0AAE9BZ23_9CAUD|nr:hypothetical protein M1M37_gp005 [Halorubrum tailed virus 25]UBF22586.1 hypothetical protein HRTV-25_gp5 [Halorubrum tailed virus 25]